MSQSGSISGSGGGGFRNFSLTGNSGGAVHPTLGNINIVGSGLISIIGNPGTSTMTVSYAGTGGTNTFHTDSGNAVESGNAITIAGGSNINTVGSGSTVTVNLDDNVTISGTFRSTAGNLTLPGTSNDGSSFGVINVGVSKISFPDAQNIYIGYLTGTYPNVGGISQNIALGESAMQQLAGPAVINNVAIGTQSFAGVADFATYNLAIGAGSMGQFKTGDNNVAIGGSALGAATAGSNNVAIGPQALSGFFLTGDANVGIGPNAGINFTTTDSHNICISNQGVAGNNGVIRIGNDTNHVSAFISGVYGITPANSPEMMTIGSDGELGSQALPLSSINITGDTGGALTGNSFTFTGGTTGLAFNGASTTETLGGTLVVANGGTGAATFTAYSVVCAGTTATGAFQNVSGVGSSGQVLTSNGAAALPTWQAAAYVGLPWTEVTGTSSAMAVNNGYIANNGALVTLTLPATAALGSIIEVSGKGAGGWSIAQNSGQTIHFGASNTTTGVGGSLSSTLQYDTVRLLCTTANTDFVVLSSVGNLTVV